LRSENIGTHLHEPGFARLTFLWRLTMWQQTCSDLAWKAIWCHTCTMLRLSSKYSDRACSRPGGFRWSLKTRQQRGYGSKVAERLPAPAARCPRQYETLLWPHLHRRSTRHVLQLLNIGCVVAEASSGGIHFACTEQVCLGNEPARQPRLRGCAEYAQRHLGVAAVWHLQQPEQPLQLSINLQQAPCRMVGGSSNAL